MLQKLVASQAPRVSSAGTTTFSAVMHGSLIAIAIALTQPASGGEIRGRLHELTSERVTYISPARLASAVAEAVRRARDAVARAAAQSSIPKLSLEAAAAISSIDLPDIDLETAMGKMTESWLAVPDDLTRADSASGSVGAMFGRLVADAPPNGGAYTPEMVERIVAPAPGNPEPRYPDALRRMGVEESFVVRFVVDTAGHVDESKIEFPTTARRQFVDAVKAALLRSRYFPATLGGHHVAQLVQQEFRFKMVP